MTEALLPADALARWRSLEQPTSSQDPSARTLAWIVRLRARMLVSGGRLTHLLVAAGLCAIEDIVACLHVQLDAGWPGDNALGYDISADLFAVASLAPLDSLERLSARLVGFESHGSGFDELHIELARRLLACDRAAEAEAALMRVDWHLQLIRLLEELGPTLTPALRERLCERAARLLEGSHLPIVYHVGLFARLAVISHDPRWLARARVRLAELAPELLEATPEYAHPIEDIAWALAELGDFEQASATIAPLEPADRWPALLRLLPYASDPTIRAAMIDELIASVEPLELAWAHLLEPLPEAAPRVLPRIWAIADESRRFEELAAAARHLEREQAEPVCAWLLAYARRRALPDKDAASIWEHTLDALHDSGCAALLDLASRSALIDDLLAHPELDLWREAAPFVPDDRVVEVFEHAHAQLALAQHYYYREQWIDLAVALLDRAPPQLVERWRVRSAEALVLTGIEDARYEQLSTWSEQREAIIRARLLHHQREFLPKQLLQPWLLWLGWTLPPSVLARAQPALERIPADVRARQLQQAEFTIVVAKDEAERARYEAFLDQLLAQPGWPTHEQVRWIFILLARCRGEAAVIEALSALAA